MLSGQLKTSCKCYLFTPPYPWEDSRRIGNWARSSADAEPSAVPHVQVSLFAVFVVLSRLETELQLPMRNLCSIHGRLIVVSARNRRAGATFCLSPLRRRVNSPWTHPSRFSSWAIILLARCLL